MGDYSMEPALCLTCGKLPPHTGSQAICAACAPENGTCNCAGCMLVRAAREKALADVAWVEPGPLTSCDVPNARTALDDVLGMELLRRDLDATRAEVDRLREDRDEARRKWGEIVTADWMGREALRAEVVALKDALHEALNEAEDACHSCQKLLDIAARGLPSSERCMRHQLARALAEAPDPDVLTRGR